MGGNPRLVGTSRLAHNVFEVARYSDKPITIMPNGIAVDKGIIDCGPLPVMEFIPREGIKVASKNLGEISAVLDGKIKEKNPYLGKEYFRARGLFWATATASLFSNAFIAFEMVSNFGDVSLLRSLLEMAWCMPNFYFLSQIFVFHTSRLKSYALESNFTEATATEVHRLKSAENQPMSLTIIPSHMEDPELLRRSLYSHCLQTYGNKKVVLLLGNDVHRSNPEVLDNTEQTLELIREIKRELAVCHDETMKAVDGFNRRKTFDHVDLGEEFRVLSAVYLSVSKWFSRKAIEIQNSTSSYPTDQYLIEHTFQRQSEYYASRAQECYMAMRGVNSNSEIEEMYLECSRIFNADLDIFLRTKYANLEQEKTKARNLTAYTSLLGGTWAMATDEEGRTILVSSPIGEHTPAPQYVSTFDSDTIAKPDYLVRKIVYMEKEENQSVGLIQSPYLLPSPEPTNIASASAIHSFWFLPVSIGMTAYSSGFWLGFNGTWRYEAMKKKGDFLAETLIEDVENSLKLRRNGYEIITSPEDQCQTFSPMNMKALEVQRTRWASGGLRIARILYRDIANGVYSAIDAKEVALRFNYVLGLNILPVAVTATFLLESPLHHEYFEIETIPFFLYLTTYFHVITSSTKYSFKNLIDGLSISFFMNFYYLRGLFHSAKVLFKRESDQLYKATPRKKHAAVGDFGNFEIVGTLALMAFMGVKMTENISSGFYMDFYPEYQLFSILWGIHRFVGFKNFLRNIAFNLRNLF
ncbi:glycosyltransferase [Candidatus Saganbacteria bacterium]|nr:glycosyltransferase [Candidatus Saganbacteria bacterium]